ncbi:MAG: hypothetical protein MUO53_04210 [Maribacter sp.]|nr:hypothetical protein [Maribacter sp.]
MRFRLHVIQLAALIMMSSCREILGEQHQNTQKENTVPSNKSNGNEMTIPKDSTLKSKELKPLKNQRGKKSRAQDTLKPVVAIA